MSELTEVNPLVERLINYLTNVEFSEPISHIVVHPDLYYAMGSPTFVLNHPLTVDRACQSHIYIETVGGDIASPSHTISEQEVFGEVYTGTEPRDIDYGIVFGETPPRHVNATAHPMEVPMDVARTISYDGMGIDFSTAMSGQYHQQALIELANRHPNEFLDIIEKMRSGELNPSTPTSIADVVRSRDEEGNEITRPLERIRGFEAARGYGADRVIVDEAAEMRSLTYEDVVSAEARYGATTGTNSNLWIGSTPVSTSEVEQLQEQTRSTEVLAEDADEFTSRTQWPAAIDITR